MQTIDAFDVDNLTLPGGSRIRTSGMEVFLDHLQCRLPWAWFETETDCGLSPGLWCLSARGSGVRVIEVEIWRADRIWRLSLELAPGSRRWVRLKPGKYRIRVTPRGRPGTCQIEISLQRRTGLGRLAAETHRVIDALRRLRLAGLARRLAGAPPRTSRHLRDGDPFGPADNAASLSMRAARVEAFDFQVGLAPETDARTVRSVDTQVIGSAKVVGYDEPAHLRLASGDCLAPDALLLAAELFARRTEVQAIVADIVVDGRSTAGTSWDSSQTAGWLGQRLAIFRHRGPLGDDEAELEALVRAYGENALAILPCPVASRAPRQGPESIHPPTDQIGVRPACVSVIVPTRDKPALIDACLTGLLSDPDPALEEVIVVDNGTIDPDAKTILATWAKHPSVRLLHVDEPFNYARLCNLAARQAKGHLLLMYNNDVAPITPLWMTRLAALFDDPDCGVVGPMLLYPDGAIQHAGVALGLFGTAGHPWRGVNPDDAHEPQVTRRGPRGAVTGACLMLRSSDYQAVGGMDEEGLPITLNDVDLCLKVAALGRRVIYDPSVRMIHDESRSRSPDHAAENVTRRAGEERTFRSRWLAELESDPGYSVARTRVDESGERRPG